MTKMPSANSNDRSLAGDVLQAFVYYAGRRRVLAAIAAIAVAGGLALKWDWLVAAGVAPVLLTLLPCAVMCALGLCMNKMTGASGASRDCCAPDSVQQNDSAARIATAQPTLPDPAGSPGAEDADAKR